ncbi:SPOR domain-containing protein [Tatumella sp. JGM130]|uniref:SPOR domain-containing protein n=1 Tax=Tatumella sp. JGM130 TaxID=2799797 RepID=UPI001BAEFA71|nr:SPOR domain-containing protein [Tatumella sp. JGM130]
MASKFQNRLVGTIILVAVGVIVLPGLLDGKKKHYKEEFASIPLVPKPGDQQDNDLVPPVTQPLSGQPALAPVSGNTAASETGTQPVAAQPQVTAPVPAAPAQIQSSQAASAALQQQEAARQKQDRLVRQQAEREASEAKAQVRAQRQASDAAEKARQLRAEQERQRALQALNDQSSAPAPVSGTSNTAETPAGQAYVIQLGALKNAARTSEIVSELRSAGFRAYSLPATPVQGQLNRILVGPDSSKSRLQSQLAALKSKTGLSGVVRPYSAR